MVKNLSKQKRIKMNSLDTKWSKEKMNLDFFEDKNVLVNYCKNKKSKCLNFKA